MTKAHNVIFTSEGVYLQDKANPDLREKMIGGRSSDNLYTVTKGNVIGTSALHATPATLKVPSNLPLHDTFNHANPKSIQDFKRDYPNSAAYILNQLSIEKQKIGQSCELCIIGKARRNPFKDTVAKNDEALDALSTDTTGPISPVDINGNAIYSLL